MDSAKLSIFSKYWAAYINVFLNLDQGNQRPFMSLSQLYLGRMRDLFLEVCQSLAKIKAHL